MRKLFSILVVLLLLTATTCLYSKVKVGDAITDQIESPHPYQGGNGLVYESVVSWPGASYIALHFSKLDLGPNDYLEICSPDGQFSYIYKGQGKVVGETQEVLKEFWATHIPGETAHVRLYSYSPRGSYGFSIDQWAHGYNREYIEAVMKGYENDFDAQIEAICTSDDKQWAKCYDGTEMYNKAKAVARLLINGTGACTGWLLGSEGHLMTNNHCISTQTEAGNTDYEFMAEGATCNTSCASWGGCPGTVAATSATLIKTDAPRDYALVKLPTNVSTTYGYLQFRNTVPTVGERIYVPQHPSAYGKQIAVTSDVDGGNCKIYSLNEVACQTGGPNDIGYYADTEGGSSGSPVLAYSDNLVVALHHCAYCPNRGVPVTEIISHLGSSLPANAIGGSTPVDPPAAPTSLGATAASCNNVSLSWTDNATDETGFKVERSTNGTSYTQIGTTAANVTSYSDTTAAGNTSYYYRVVAYNGGGNSAYSNVATVTTPVCPVVAPTAPSTLTLTPSKNSVSVTWTDSSTNETGFRIYRGTTSSNLTLVATVGANVTSYNNTGLARRTTYYYKVCAYNTAGEGCSVVKSTKTK